MRFNILVLVAVSLLSSYVNAQAKEAALEDLNWTATVTNDEAIFLFPKSTTNNWSWHLAETPDNQLEYRWDVRVGEYNSGFQFGLALFKPGDSVPNNGTMKDLIERCQNDMWKLSDEGGENVGSYGETSIEGGKVRIVVTSQITLDMLFESKPTEVWMAIQTPDSLIQKKVNISYGK